MADQVYVVHDGGERLCQPGLTGNSPPYWAGPHCATCTCGTTHGPADPEGGRWVTCGYCGRTGIEVRTLQDMARFVPRAEITETESGYALRWRP